MKEQDIQRTGGTRQGEDSETLVYWKKRSMMNKQRKEWHEMKNVSKGLIVEGL